MYKVRSTFFLCSRVVAKYFLVYVESSLVVGGVVLVMFGLFLMVR